LVRLSPIDAGHGEEFSAIEIALERPLFLAFFIPQQVMLSARRPNLEVFSFR
jgi:hypothetical protein